MKNKVWSWIVAVAAYSLPVIVGLTITLDGSVLWGYVPLLLHFVLFWYSSDLYDDETAGRKGLMSAKMAMVFGFLITVTLLILHSPYVLWLTLGQFILSWIVFAMTSSK